MKHTFYIIVLLLTIAACKSEKKHQEICSSKVDYGDTTFCLPKLSNYKEVLKKKAFKKQVAAYQDTLNTTLAFYVANEVAQKETQLDTIAYDDYYKVYTFNSLQEYTFTRPELKQVVDAMVMGFSTSENNTNLPKLLHKRRYSEDALGAIVLMDNNLVSMNAFIVNDRLLFMAHYLNYDKEASIEEIEENSKNFIYKFTEVNNKEYE